ncbi:MAG: conserved protein of unknown function [Nitrospira sp.]
MTQVLVTGAGGFLGRALTEDLVRSGHRVRALIRRPALAEDVPGADTIVGDVRDPRCAGEAARGCDAVVHLAGLVHAADDKSLTEADYRSVNVDGTRHLLDAAVAGGVSRFLFASSVKVFGETTAGCADERTAPDPQTPYARSKWEAEQAVAASAMPGRFATVSLRLPLVYGRTAKGNLYRMIDAINRGRFPPLPRVRALRSLLSVKNFVLAVRALLQPREVARPCYVVTDEAPYSVTDIYDLLRRGLGLPPPSWRVPLPLLTFAGACGDLLQLCVRRPMPLTSATLVKLIGQAWYSPDALMREAGYRPFDRFDAAVPDLVRHYRQSRS